MYEEEYSSATEFFCSILTPEDILSLEVLMKKISRAPSPAKRYLESHCRDVRELREFFKNNQHLFYVENKRMALFDERFIKDSEMAVCYFKEKLELLGNPVNYMLLKMKYLEHAPRRVCYFVTRFYPGKELKKFFKRKPDVFVLHKDDTVFLVEADSVEFYRKKLKTGDKQYFLHFRGKIGQAEPHVQQYINKNYLGDAFQDFLIKNSDVFRLDENGFVSLVSSK